MAPVSTLNASEKLLTTHLVIPDTQVTPDTPTDHLRWIGLYILEKKPDVIIHLGDHWDMQSLSSYDRGKLAMEGRRYKADVQAGNTGLRMLDEPTVDANRKRKQAYKPKKHLLRGNHEYRIERAIEENPQLEGLIGYHDLNTRDWEVHDFLEVVEIDGISYSHYFANPMSGKPYGGQAHTRIKTIGTSFTMGHQQTLDTAIRYLPNGDQQRALIAGACLTPDHKVLTADLKYIPLGDVLPGQRLVSFDETTEESEGRSRRFKTGTVKAVKRDVAEVFLVTLDNGKEFKVTNDHLWLTKTGSKYEWRENFRLRKGTRVVKPLDEWEAATSYNAGYLSGIIDGEGCYYKRTTHGGVIGQLTISQKPGLVLDKIRASLDEVVGVDCTSDLNQRGVVSLRMKGGLRSIAKVFGTLRPVRLLDKFQPEDLGRLTTTDADNPAVVSIESIGEQEIVRIDVDARTMIVEGYAHHNCYLHDEDYKGPQGNSHWRGIIMCHGVHNGEYDIMEVSLDFLCRKYEGVPVKEFLMNKYGKSFS